jgi:geranylgeranyl pyrophosphate synthase
MTKKEIIICYQQLINGMNWGDIETILQYVTEREPQFWQYYAHVFRAVNSVYPVDAVGQAALSALHAGILLVDDVLDGEDHFPELGIPAHQKANLASALQAAGLDLVLSSRHPDALRLAAARCLNTMLFNTASGQQLETALAPSEAAYWQIARAKSSPFFAAVFELGAIMGGGNPEQARTAAKLGAIYGEVIQIEDDLNDVFEVPAEKDWADGSHSLPVLFAANVQHPDRERFNALRVLVADPDILHDAQQILIRCGAVSYCFYEISNRVKQAMEIIHNITWESASEMEVIFLEVKTNMDDFYRHLNIPVAGG